MVDLLFSETPIRALQDALSPLFDGLFLAITSTGSTLFLLVLVLMVYWLWDKRAGLFIGVVLLSSGAMNVLLKDLFQMPRPPSQLHITSAQGTDSPVATPSRPPPSGQPPPCTSEMGGCSWLPCSSAS